MTRRCQLWMVTVALCTALTMPALLPAAPARAQLPSPALENGAAGDGTGAAPLPGASLPILAVLLLVGAGIGLCAVVVLRRVERQNDPDVRARQHREREAQRPDLRS